jgi:hypothetical protein
MTDSLAQVQVAKIEQRRASNIALGLLSNQRLEKRPRRIVSAVFRQRDCTRESDLGCIVGTGNAALRIFGRRFVRDDSSRNRPIHLLRTLQFNPVISRYRRAAQRHSPEDNMYRGALHDHTRT